MLKYLYFTVAVVLGTLFFSSCSSDLKVISYNIRYNSPNDGLNKWDNRKESVVGLIESKAPDFIGMQEVVHEQLHYLNTSLNDYSFIGVGRDDGKTKGEYSPIFYQKKQFKLIHDATFWLSETPDSISVGWDAALPRICTYGLFENIKNGQRLYVFNTHFDHIGEVARIASTQLILERMNTVNKENLPIVLTGDFNLTPDTKPIKHLQSEMLDSGQKLFRAFPNLQGTFNGFDMLNNATRRLDYIFSKGFDLLDVAHLLYRTPSGGWASDHHAVWSEFSYKK